MKYMLNGKEVTQEEFFGEDSGKKLKEMLESGQPPMSNTDREFLEGNQFSDNEKMGAMLSDVARRNGGSPTGKRYVGQLARYAGDPEAWVSDRGELQKRIEERGAGAEGTVNVKGREPKQRVKTTRGQLHNLNEMIKTKGTFKERLRKKGLGSDILGEK